ncbi:hypothetical protein HPP92_018307 [Vanilla planifolia]|uniref:DUF5600 domain-containing protein n=1 Tax=Vanilla planifolia TaxID=51239 RepID=A0A835QCK1_VANPL|nr:hypothetical protein HPP92_018307 [Vanilla planifolia]
MAKVPSMDIIPPQISSCSREHQKIYQEWFAFADSVWAVADSKRQGFLGFSEFVTAMQEKEITPDVLNSIDMQSLKPPYMEGLDIILARHKPSPKKSDPDLDEIVHRKIEASGSFLSFNDFVSPLLTNSDFDAKPMVMLLGQYSTGKTTFIKHLLRTSYPGAHIGPEPTTDRFVVVMSGPDERSIPGNTIAVQADMPYSGLTSFGTAFYQKFECSQMPHPRTQRSYDFTGVTSWFAAKCDLILLLFDPHKLDISDEFKRVIGALRGHDDKIRVVLNKADQIDTQQLMRVYGALMWSLGKVLNTPEVMRVYIGNYLRKEQDDLLSDLKDIPKKACDRRINEFVKRARAAKIHAYIISHLKKEMPSMMGKAKAQQRLIDNLEDEFLKVHREYHLPSGDFPNVEHFRRCLAATTSTSLKS